MKQPCHICGLKSLDLFLDFQGFGRVTSDCKPWPAGGKLGICDSCGTVQAVVDDAWRAECREIYTGYTIYHQAGGAEQAVFESESGASWARSDRLLARVAEAVAVPETGRLLDIGCGNGGFLRSFGRKFPGWRLCGSEFDEKHRAEIESLPGVEGFFACDITDTAGTFDAISLIHVLEHIEAPLDFLRNVREKLKPGGLLLVEVPHFVDNPFELFIADHATHFEIATARSLLGSAGFKVKTIESNWIAKEISALAVNEEAPAEPPASPSANVERRLAWLSSVVADAKSISEKSERFGIFGTSIAATWLFNELEGAVAFFVDEDPARVGRQHLGLPIYTPGEVPENSDVYVALPSGISPKVASRLRTSAIRYHEVPELT